MNATEIISTYHTSDPFQLARLMNVVLYSKELPEYVCGLYIPMGGNGPAIVLNSLRTAECTKLLVPYLLGVHTSEKPRFYVYSLAENTVDTEFATFAFVLLSKSEGFGLERLYLKHGAPPQFIAAMHHAWNIGIGKTISPLLFGALTADGKLIYASESHKQWIGLEPHEICGSNPFLIVHPEDRPYVKHQFLKLVTDKMPMEVTYRYVSVDGQSVPIFAVGTPLLSEDGKVEQVIITAKVLVSNNSMHPELFGA